RQDDPHRAGAVHPQRADRRSPQPARRHPQEPDVKLPIDRPLSREEQDATAAEGIDNWNRYVRRFPSVKDRDRDRNLVEWSGEGPLIRNIYGEEYIDCLGGYGIFSLGHRHPEVIAAVKSQMDRMPLHSQYLVNPITAEAGRCPAPVP